MIIIIEIVVDVLSGSVNFYLKTLNHPCCDLVWFLSYHDNVVGIYTVSKFNCTKIGTVFRFDILTIRGDVVQ